MYGQRGKGERGCVLRVDGLEGDFGCGDGDGDGADSLHGMGLGMIKLCASNDEEQGIDRGAQTAPNRELGE